MNELLNIEARINQLIEQQKSLHINDPSVSLIWEEMTTVLSANIQVSIAYMRQAKAEDLSWISQVFEDVVLRTQSSEYLHYLHELKKQEPHSDMIASIDIAIGYYLGGRQ